MASALYVTQRCYADWHNACSGTVYWEGHHAPCCCSCHGVRLGDVWDLGDWAVVFTSPEREAADLRIAYAEAQKSVTVHESIEVADEWLAGTERYKDVRARLIWRQAGEQ